MPRYDAEWIQSMLRPELRGSPPAEDILAAIGLKGGQIVADIGCGPGFLTIPAATLVGPTGRIYAVDLEPAMLDDVQRRAAAIGLTNLETRSPTDSTIPLADASVDVTLCSLVLHDLDDQAGLVRDLARVTRSGGKIAIVEWVADASAPRKNRIPPSFVADLLAVSGLVAGEAIPLPPMQYLIVAVNERRTPRSMEATNS